MKIIIILVLICLSLFSLSSDESLTKEEKQQIDSYIDTSPLENLIGQVFMIGIKTDFKNYQNSDEIKSLLKENSFGSVMLNSYNYYDPSSDDDYMHIDNIISFNNFLQDNAQRSPVALPLLLAVDFETPKFSSIKKGLELPIPPLTLSCSQDSKILKTSGLLNGLQLSKIGINLLLGPTLDISNVNQSASKSLLLNRPFAGNKQGVINSSSNFISGLLESKIAFFIKHLPGHGSVESNPHDKEIPCYTGGPTEFENDMRPFTEFLKYSDGMMTSHIVLPAINGLEKEFVTFSKIFIDKYVKKIENNQDKILITDDLSSMGAITKYMEINNMSLSKVAIKAFDAGHDILLFSHTDESNGKNPNLNTYEDIIKIKKDLYEHIKANNNEIRLKHSIKKVLYLKAHIHKSKGGSISELFTKTERKTSFWRVSDNSEQIFRSINDTLSKVMEIKDSSTFSYEAIKKASTLIHSIDNIKKFNSITPNETIATYCDDEFTEKFKGFLEGKTSKINFIKKETFGKTKEQLIQQIQDSDLTIFFVVDEDDRNLLDYIRIKDTKSLRLNEKIIVFVLAAPTILQNESLNHFQIISLSTNHPKSLKVIQELLTDDIHPIDIKNFPIKIGSNGGYHSLDNVTWVKKADFISNKDDNISSSLNKDESSSFNYSNIMSFAYIVFQTLLLSAYFYHFKEKEGTKKFFNFRSNNIVLAVIIPNVLAIIFIYFFNKEIHDNQTTTYVLDSSKKYINKKIDE